MGRPILCIDFDGVIHSYESGWHGADVVSDGPVPGAMEFLKEATKHFVVHVYSSRSGQKGGLAAMEQAIEWWMVEAFGATEAQQIVDSLVFAHEKPAAFVTIDDRAIRFEGTFPPMADLIAFKPWNKKDV
jgi:hypothetical protein